MTQEELQNKFDEALEEMKAWADLKIIPDSLAEAASGEWSIVSDDATDDITTQAGDVALKKSKVMSATKAQEILEDFEEKLVKAMTLGTGEIIGSKMTSYIRAAESVIKNRDEIWEFIESLQSLESLVVFLAEEALTVLLLASLKKTLEAGKKELPGFLSRSEKACFPQSLGKRFRVKRRTRT